MNKFFETLNKALMDERVPDSHFKVLYFILNGITYGDGDSIERTNKYIGERLHMSERTIERATANLSKLGYIEKTSKGSKYNRRGNSYKEVKNDPIKPDKNDGFKADKFDTQQILHSKILHNNTSNNNINYTIEKEKLNKKKKDWMTSSYQSVLKTTDFSQVENKEFKEYLESISRNETQIQKTSPMIRSGIYDTVIKHIEYCIGLLQCGVITQEEYNKYLDYSYV